MALIAGLWLLVACSGPASSTPSAAPTSGPTGAPTLSPSVAPSLAPSVTAGPSPTVAPAAFTLTSTAFADNEPIPVEYTCDGDDRPLPLAWSGAPAGTVELALILDDPDAGGFVHWVVVGIPGDATGLGDPLPPGAAEGMTDFGQAAYGGPCPPAEHAYLLTLYALSGSLGLSGEPTAAEVRAAAAGKTLATAVLTGTYRPA